MSGSENFSGTRAADSDCRAKIGDLKEKWGFVGCVRLLN
jgi:hypothetical protein